MLDNLPGSSCLWEKFGSFFNVLQPLGLHSYPSFHFVSLHKREEIHHFFDWVSGDACIAIKRHELLKPHEEIVCVVPFTIKFFQWVSFQSSPLWLIHSSIQIFDTKGVIS